MKVAKYFKGAKAPEPMVDPVTISKKQYEYFLSALTFARKHGFKITIFNENGKPIALQG